MNSLTDVILFSLAVVALIIGVHQTFVFGFSGSYWILMICIALLLVYKIRKDKNAQAASSSRQKKPKKKNRP